MSRDKGSRAAAWVAAYLRTWWPAAEKLPNGLRGRDITGTPSVAFEVKTGVTWRESWMAQAAKYGDRGDLPVLVYLAPGIGEANVASAQAVMPLHALMRVLEAAGYAPTPLGEIQARLAAAGQSIRNLRDGNLPAGNP